VSVASTGVFVLGMHRSGTSATTRAVNLLGVPVAAEEELKPASPNNPTGFWEVPRLTDLNNRLLGELGGSSLGPPLLAPGWSRNASLDDLRRRARMAFGKAHPTETWVWKDPRNCVLFPFWSEALDARPVVILVHREPAEVARSLGARQGLSGAMSFAVWERYMREALTGADGLPVFVAPYRRLVTDPRAWAREVGEFLRDEGLASDPGEGAARVAEFIESSPRGDSPGGDPDFELSDSQRRVVAALEELAGRHERFTPPELPAETRWTEPLLAERRRADLIRRQMEERLKATRRRARVAKAGKSDATELPKQRAGGRAPRSSGRRASIRDPRSALRLFPGRRGSSHRGDGGRLPDYLIIGAQKSGTSSLFRYLGESRHVDLPSEKEIHFFDNGFEKGIDWYRAHFPATSGGGKRRMTGEASPYYVFHPLAAQRIRETIPDVRLLLLLRNPVERAVSHYYHEVGNGFEELPLAAALDREEERLAGEAERLVAEPGYSSFNHRHFSYQARGRYADQLERWRSVFPEDQLLVLNSDDLFGRPVQEMQRVYDFLGLPDKPGEDLGAYNQRDYPAVPQDVRTRLAERFAPHNTRLYELVGRDYGWDSAVG
jgi:Sulfotransferase domain